MKSRKKRGKGLEKYNLSQLEYLKIRLEKILSAKMNEVIHLMKIYKETKEKK